MKNLDIIVIEKRLDIILYLLIVILSFGCMTSKKFVRYANNHKLETAEICHDLFPSQERLIKGVTDTITKIEYKDSIIVKCPPVEAKNGQLVTNTVTCPPSKTIVKYVNRVDTVIKPDEAAIYALQTKLDKSEAALKQTQDDLKKETERKNKAQNIAIMLGLVCAILTFLLIRK